MNSQPDEADLLDRFFDDLHRDGGASAPAALDAGLARLARGVVAAEQGAAPPAAAEVQARVWQRALAGAASPVPPRAVPAPRRAWAWPFPARALRLAGGLALLLLLVVGAGLALTPRAASAAEILARAVQVADQADAFGLQSYQGLIQGRSQEAAPAILEWQEEIVFAAPNRRRLTFQATITTPTPAVPATPVPPGTTLDPWIFVSDGTQAWTYQPARRYAAQVDPHMQNIGGTAFGATNLQELLRNAASENAVQLAGTDTVAGRPATVLDLVPHPDTHASYQRGTVRVREWIDSQTYLLLGSEERDAAGTVLYRWAFTRIVVNGPVDAAQFTFTPPAGVPLVDARPSPTPTGADLAAAWRQIAGQVAFPLFRPGAVPTWLTPAGNPTQSGPLVSQTYRSRRAAAALVIAEAAGFALGPVGGGTAVPVGGATARYQEQGDMRWLVLVRDGTTVTLQGRADVTREVLLAIAESLEPVK